METGNPAWLPFNYSTRSLKDDAWLAAADDIKWKRHVDEQTVTQENYHNLWLTLADLRYVAIAGLSITPGKITDFLNSLPSNRARSQQGQNNVPPNSVKARLAEPGETVRGWLTGAGKVDQENA